MPPFHVIEALKGVREVPVTEVAVEQDMVVDVMVPKTFCIAELNDVSAVSTAKVARGSLEVVVAFRNVREGFAAFSAPDRRLLVVLDIVVVVVELCDVLEFFAACSTFKEKLLFYENLVHLDVLSLAGLLLPRPRNVRSVRDVDPGKGNRFVKGVVASFVLGTSRCPKILFTCTAVEILIFRKVDCVFTFSFEEVIRRHRGRTIIECTSFVGIRIARCG